LKIMGHTEKRLNTGSIKKSTVIYALNWIIDHSMIPNDLRDELQAYVKQFLPHMIDSIIYLARNKKVLKQFVKNNCKGKCF